MENNIIFNKGDIVCIKPKYMSPLGLCESDIKDIRPLIVDRVQPDRDYENRVGENGNANQYYLHGAINGNKLSRYQYELCMWVSIKDLVIHAIDKELQILKSI